MTHCCYNLIVHLGISDVFQLTMHAIGGAMSLAQTVWDVTFNGIVGGVGVTMWFSYNMFTDILAFNRFIEMGFPRWSKILFGPLGTKVCVALGYIYGIPWLIGYMTGPVFIYIPNNYAWHYNKTAWFTKYIQPANSTQNAVHLSLIVTWYLLLLFKLKVLKSNMAAQSQSQASARAMENAVLMTCGFICGMLFFPSTIWHFWYLFLPAHKWTFFALDFLWLLNSGMNPVIYFTINKTIQKRVKALVGFKSAATGTTENRVTANAVKSRIRGVAPSQSRAEVKPIGKGVGGKKSVSGKSTKYEQSTQQTWATPRKAK